MKICGLIFDHENSKIRGLIVDCVSFICSDRVEVDYVYEPRKTEQDYNIDYQPLIGWLARNQGHTIVYVGPKLSGGQKRYSGQQTQQNDPLEDSRAFMSALEPYYKKNIPPAKDPPTISGADKATIEMLFEVGDESDLETYAIAIALKQYFGSKVKYAKIASDLQKSNLYKNKAEFVEIFCEESRRRRMGYAALKRAKERFDNPTKTLAAAKDALSPDKIRMYEAILS